MVGFTNEAISAMEHQTEFADSHSNNERRQVKERVDTVVSSLMDSMTLADKIGQMAQVDINALCEDDPHEEGKKRLSREKLREFVGVRGIGSVLNVPGGKPWSAREYREASIELQQEAEHYGRPPVLWGLDSIHGANFVEDSIILPQPINLAATFNQSTARAAGLVSSRDSRAAGIHWIFAPLLGLAIESKWPRVYETFGEDPWLVGEMATHFIQGLQKEDSAPGVFPTKAAACAKHFIGYSAPHNGHDRSPSWIPTRHLYQYFVSPWEKAIREGQVESIMESYTDIDGVPNVANPNTLQYLLRQRLDFHGVLLTDYREIMNLQDWHRIQETDQEAIAYAFREGSVDVSMIPFDDAFFIISLQNAISKQSLTQARIDQSVQRILQLKQNLNLLGDDAMDMMDPNLDLVGTNVQQSLDMARESIILTQNTDDCLPLHVSSSSSTTKTKVAVMGPTAHSIIFQSGGWTQEWQGIPDDATTPRDQFYPYGSTVLEATKNIPSWDVEYACGVDIFGDECTTPEENHVVSEESSSHTTPSSAWNQLKNWAGMEGDSPPPTSMEAAGEVSADVIILCLGEPSYAEKPGDIPSLELPIGQYELVSVVRNKNPNAKIILVYFGGRPRLLRDVVEHVDAVLVGFLPGPTAGQAVLDIITGKVNPSAKLPVTYPKYDDEGGVPYYHAVSDQCTKSTDDLHYPQFTYEPCQVQWPFGHGLGYSTFEYSDLTISSESLQYHPLGHSDSVDQELLTISVNVKNKGPFDGAETVLFFSFDEARIVTPENKRLRAFEKVFLTVGDEQTVSTTISIQDLKFIGPHDDTHLIIQDGLMFRIGVGASTDCHDDDKLCSNTITIRSVPNEESDNTGACEAACNLWTSSGCAQLVELSAEHCWSMCTTAGLPTTESTELGLIADGWGWNYVSCLESLVEGMQDDMQLGLDMGTQCRKMTTLCRDIFSTEGLDQFGHFGGAREIGDAPPPAPSARAQDPAKISALAVGILASVIIILAIRGCFQSVASESAEFSPVEQEDEEAAAELTA